ncbi:MAG: undecaprenyl/decaprenyl-phosphate alpha-N-acetylglucosaminyl 1-phosphate transferase, partial [Bacteroidia bacterium]|nr:undecaprenyl/decaprenyl-phosphate alpha-N-acetylglucosaminyl 1-phosphate transferase [Bacteroidia bacterium]
RLFLRFLYTLGIREHDKIIRWGTESKPSVGGFSFFIIFLLSIVCYSIFFDVNKVFLNREFFGLLVACILGFLLGLADDAYNTQPFLKFNAQLTCGILLMVSGIQVNISSWMPLNYFLTVFWVVGIMNSLNMLDNMDAIASSVAIMVILGAISIMLLNEDYSGIFMIILIGMLGAIIGFLFYNWYPSVIYMGDTGSQFLGVFLAAIGIKFFWQPSTIPTVELIDFKTIIIPVLMFIVPIVDTTTVFINRIMRRQSPFVGGKDHTTHSLAYIGLSERQVALTVMGVSLLSILLVICIVKFITVWTPVYTFLFVAYILLVLGIMFSITFFKTKTE